MWASGAASAAGAGGGTAGTGAGHRRLPALAGSGTTGGWAEVDANPNPLREQVLPLNVVDGWASLPDAPGLGVEPDLQALASYLVVV